MSIPTWTLKKHKRGDTWSGVNLTLSQDLAGASIEIVFRRQSLTGPVSKAFSTQDGTITIISTGPTSVFRMQPFQCFMLTGLHFAELIITYADGDVKTLPLNINWEIIE